MKSITYVDCQNSATVPIIFEVLYKAPYAILYHHGLELPEKGLYDSSDDCFCASLPMHTMPDKLNDSGIEITNNQTAFGR